MCLVLVFISTIFFVCKSGRPLDPICLRLACHDQTVEWRLYPLLYCSYIGSMEHLYVARLALSGIFVIYTLYPGTSDPVFFFTNFSVHFRIWVLRRLTADK